MNVEGLGERGWCVCVGGGGGGGEGKSGGRVEERMGNSTQHVQV